MTREVSRKLLEDAVRALHVAKRKIATLESRGREPVAIIGIGCRFPGANGPEALWRLSRDVIDTTSEVPKYRWDVDPYYTSGPAQGDKTISRWGGFLADAEPKAFVGPLFGLKSWTDENWTPSQRLVLEVAWEAVERAGMSPKRLEGSRTGVFVGAPEALCAPRLSNVFDLRGPCESVDVASSSALAAVHQACTALRAGECELALAASVNLLTEPDGYIALSALERLSRFPGACKTFDSRADGLVRAEGCGVVVLKRLSDAERDLDPIVAVIRGSAVGHAGRGLGFLQSHGVNAIESVLRRSAASAGCEGSAIAYAEQLGAATPLGDAMEVSAVASSLGPAKSANERLPMGSIETTIGHADHASGMAGLIRVAMMLQCAEIPPEATVREAHPYLDLASIEIPMTRRPWSQAQGQRIAGVLALGVTGGIGHVLLDEPALPVRNAVAPATLGSARLFTLSAQSEQELRWLAGDYQQWLEESTAIRLADVCYTGGAARAHMPHRLATVVTTTAELKARLGSFTKGTSAPGVTYMSASAVPKIGLLIASGQALGAGAAAELYGAEPIFRKAVDACLAVNAADAAASRENPFALQQGVAMSTALVFAAQWGLVEMWRGWGVKPRAAVGDGVGELVGAVASGLVGLEEAMRLASAGAQQSQRPWRQGGREAQGAFAVSSGNGDPGARELVSLGCDTIIAIGPIGNVRCSGVLDPKGRAASDGLVEVLGGLASLYLMGADVTWNNVMSEGVRRLAMPTYPFASARPECGRSSRSTSA